MDTKYCDECDKSVSRKNWARHMSLKHPIQSDDSDIESRDKSENEYSDDDNDSSNGEVKKLERKLRIAKRKQYIFKEDNDDAPDEKIGKLYLYGTKSDWYVADAIRSYNEWASPNLTEALEELTKIKDFLASKFHDFEEHMEAETDEDDDDGADDEKEDEEEEEEEDD